MYRKVAAVWVSLFIMVSSIVILVEIADRVEAPITLYVGGGGGGNYSKIQWAIDNASSGDTVFVYNGTYHENVVVNKSINLTGEDMDNTVINGSGSGDVVLVTKDWVNISGFTITGGGFISAVDSGIELEYVQNCSIFNNNISSNNQIGIHLRYSNGNVISGNRVFDNKYGLRFWFSNRSRIVNNTISSYNYWGLYFYFSNENNLTDNKVTNNNYGIYLHLSDRNNILDNNASNNSRGIHLFHSHYNNITYNKVCLNRMYGIILETSDGNDISNNNSTNNSKGIYLESSSGNNVTNNNVSDNDYGIYLDSSNKNNITGNNVSGSWTGIRLDYSMSNTISENIALNNAYGISVYSSSGNTITNNSMKGNGIFIEGNLLEHWNTHYIDTSNTVNGKPVYYWKNQNGGIIPVGAGQVILANCTNSKIESQNLTNCSVGIELGFSSNNEITSNNASSNYWYGIYIYSSSGNNITNNNASNNFYGLFLKYSDWNGISNNIVSSNDYQGIYLYSSHSNIITGNNASFNSWYGIDIYLSANNNITDNTMVNDGIIIEGSQIEHWNTHNIDTSNTVNGKPVHYLKNQTGGIVPSGAGEVILANCTNVKVENQIITNGSIGIELGFSSNNKITSTNVSFNKRYAILLYKSSWNNITTNNVSNNENGINIYSSNGNNITGNTLSKNILGIVLSSSNRGNITGNILFNNSYGIALYWSLNNRIYHNNFIDNTYQAYDTDDSTLWNDTYPLGGNYWSDYIGNDSFKGPNQDQPGSDGIGDTNHSIDSDSVDNYPLLEPIENYTFLRYGWNLISTPLIQDSQYLDKVLEMIDGFYNAVQWYDGSDSIDKWKHYNLDKSFGNDLIELNETKGFWIHISTQNGAILLHNGTQPTVNQTIQLHPGWNMVGYPSLSNHNRTVGLNNLTFDTHVDAIQWFDAATKTWHFMGPDDYFVPGRGYWVHSKVEAGWEVPL